MRPEDCPRSSLSWTSLQIWWWCVPERWRSPSAVWPSLPEPAASIWLSPPSGPAWTLSRGWSRRICPAGRPSPCPAALIPARFWTWWERRSCWVREICFFILRAIRSRPEFRGRLCPTARFPMWWTSWRIRRWATLMPRISRRRSRI